MTAALSASKATHYKLSHSGASKQAMLARGSKGVERHWSLARHWHVSLVQEQQVACLNYTLNSRKKAVEFNKHMNLIPIQLCIFLNSYGTEFIHAFISKFIEFKLLLFDDYLIK
jgi:hypothetical protein